MGKIFDALQKLEKEEDRLIFESDKIITETKFANKVKTNKELKTDVVYSHENTINKNLILKKEEKSLITDQFRILRTQVLKKCRELNKRSLLITSAMPQEGKTTISSNLAVGISQCINEKAILLDFDLRKPNISSLFNINGKAGILEYLIDGINLSTIIYTTEINNMLLIPAGKSDKHPSDIVSAKKVEQLLNTLKSEYKDYYIIIDSTPIELTPEVSILADKVDSVLFVIGANVTKREQIAHAIKKIDKNKIIGIAFNGADQRLSYYKSYYTDYYKSYG